MRVPARPIVVYGEASRRYDFGPAHPLTPRRFGPGIDLVRTIGTADFLEPGPASDAEIERLHDRRYIGAVKRYAKDPTGWPEAGIGHV